MNRITVIFFNKDIETVRALMQSKSRSVAFWYSPGLLSYEYLSDILEIEEVLVEASVYEDFKISYPDLIVNVKHSGFGMRNMEHVKRTFKPILFLSSSDTITKSFKPLVDLLGTVPFKMVCKPRENAKHAADVMGIPAVDIHLSVQHISSYSALVMGNDWGPTERKLNEEFLLAGINTVCIQESSIDFNSRDNRMRFCSFPIFQGVATLQNMSVNGLICAVIGNPRFEDLKKSPLPERRRALVNVNFTYGIHEEVRQTWVQDIVSSCAEVEIDYIISQHPRDTGNLSQYNVLQSNSMLVHDSIRESSVVISRFSALLTEAICLGRPCIYYNPHQEEMHYKFEADNKMFFLAKNKTELAIALTRINELQSSSVINDMEFIKKHLGVTHSGLASHYIKMALLDISAMPAFKKGRIINLLKICLIIIKRIVRRQRY